MLHCAMSRDVQGVLPRVWALPGAEPEGEHQGPKSKSGREDCILHCRASLVHSSKGTGKRKITFFGNSCCPFLLWHPLVPLYKERLQWKKDAFCFLSSRVMRGGCPKGPRPPPVAGTLKYSAAGSQRHLKLSVIFFPLIFSHLFRSFGPYVANFLSFQSTLFCLKSEYILFIAMNTREKRDLKGQCSP